MRSLRILAISLVIAIAGMMVVSPAISQISIRVNPEHRERHRVFYHHRHVVYHPRPVVYHHRHAVYHHRDEGVRVRLNVR